MRDGGGEGDILEEGAPRGTPLYDLHGEVLLDSVWFLASLS